MNEILWLRWSLAAVLGAGAVLLLVALAGGGHLGLHAPLAAAIAVAEVAGAVLLVVPRTRRLGGAVLLATLAAAALLHALAGQVPPLAFVVYAAAIAVAMRREVVS